MAVLIVPSWYKPGGGAQLGAFFREQALALKKSGIDVVVADATLQGRGFAWRDMFHLKRFDDEGLLTYSYITPALGVTRLPLIGAWLSRFLYRQNLKKIYRFLRKDGVRIEIVHAHSVFPAGDAVVRLFARHEIPTVVTEHASSVITGRLRLDELRALQRSVSLSDAFICVSAALKNAVVKLTGTHKEIAVIPNVVDARFGIGDVKKREGFVFASIGNLLPGKRFDLTLSAFREAFANDPSITLRIIGDGPLRDSLTAKANELGISDRVGFEGRLSRAQVAEALQESDALVLPSDFETFGVVYIEALACGLPVVATRNGGADDIVTERCGKLVDVGNLSQLIQAMRFVYEHYDMYDKQLIARECRERFGGEAVSAKLYEVYQTVLRKEGGGIAEPN